MLEQKNITKTTTGNKKYRHVKLQLRTYKFFQPLLPAPCMCECMRVHLFTQVEVDSPDWPAGLLVLVVLKDIRLTAQPAAAQHKPTLLPCLEIIRDHVIQHKIFQGVAGFVAELVNG